MYLQLRCKDSVNSLLTLPVFYRALDILEELILVGMNQLQSTVNTAMPLRKRGLPLSFWNFCAADTVQCTSVLVVSFVHLIR